MPQNIIDFNYYFMHDHNTVAIFYIKIKQKSVDHVTECLTKVPFVRLIFQGTSKMSPTGFFTEQETIPC